MKAIRWCFAFALGTFLVGCGGGGGGADTGQQTPPVANTAPTANAGPIQNVVVGAAVILDGSGSDANGDALTYNWSLVVPSGSAASLSAGTTPKPTFVVDVAGTYTATLVVNDGKVNSISASVTITATVANAAPVANAGVAQNVVAGTLVTLDGSASSDANGDQLTYLWSLTSKPAGSNAAMASGATARPTFTADAAGTYVASLTVNDGKVNSTAATVTVTAAVANAAPVANAGAAQRVTVSSSVMLDASASSDANGDSLSYLWSLTAKPAGSAAALSSSTSLTSSFVADIAGTYLASLRVNDGSLSSSPVSATITAVPRIAGAFGISLTDAFNFCAISGTLTTSSTSGTGTWTFNNCRVYGTAGSILWVRIQNNGKSAIQLTQIYILSGIFGNTWNIDASSQAIAPGTTSNFALPMWLGIEVTNATATLTLTGESPLVIPLTGSTELQ